MQFLIHTYLLKLTSLYLEKSKSEISIAIIMIILT